MATTSKPPSLCPRCGAALATPQCEICLELCHLQYLLTELDRWREEEALPPAATAQLRQRYRRQHEDLLRAAGPAPPAPRPSADPTPAPAPNPLETLRSETGFTWIYAVGALFIVAGLGWLIYLSHDHAWGRWLTTLVISAATVGALAVGRWMRGAAGLTVGGDAILAIGTALSAAALFAARDAAGWRAPWLTPGCWAGGMSVALILTWQLRLPSQLTLANLLAVLLSYSAAAAISGGRVEPPALLGLLLAPLAVGNLALVVLLRRTAGDGLEDSLQRTARGGAALLALVATVTVVSTADPFPDTLEPIRLLAPLLLGGAILALAYELTQPALVAAAAAAWLWFAYALGAVTDGLFWQLATVGGLIVAAGLERARRPSFGAWYLGAAVVATGILLAPRLPELIDGADAWTASAAWLLVVLYTATAPVWRDVRLLAPPVLLLVLAVLFTVSAVGLPGRWAPAALALVALVQQLAAGRCRAIVWRERSVGETLAPLALVPQVLGLGVAWAMAAAGLIEPLTLAAVVILCLESFVLSYQIGRSDLLYLTLVGGALAGFLIDRVWQVDADPVLVAIGCGGALLAGALWQGRHLRPFEILATAMFGLLPWLRLPELAQGQLAATVAASLAALGLALPAWPGLDQRSHWRELNDRLRPSLAIALAALGAMGLARWLRFQPEVGPLLVAGGRLAPGGARDGGADRVRGGIRARGAAPDHRLGGPACGLPGGDAVGRRGTR